VIEVLVIFVILVPERVDTGGSRGNAPTQGPRRPLRSHSGLWSWWSLWSLWSLCGSVRPWPVAAGC